MNLKTQQPTALKYAALQVGFFFVDTFKNVAMCNSYWNSSKEKEHWPKFSMIDICQSIMKLCIWWVSSLVLLLNSTWQLGGTLGSNEWPHYKLWWFNTERQTVSVWVCVCVCYFLTCLEHSAVQSLITLKFQKTNELFLFFFAPTSFTDLGRTKGRVFILKRYTKIIQR